MGNEVGLKTPSANCFSVPTEQVSELEASTGVWELFFSECVCASKKARHGAVNGRVCGLLDDFLK